MKDKFVLSTNPAKNYAEISRVAVSSTSQVEAAVAAAHKAWPAWREQTVAQRSEPITKFRELLKAHLEEIASLQTQEMGKPITQSRDECKAILHWLKWQLQEAPKILAVRSLDQGPGWVTELHLEPYGVEAVIAPWNYPTYQFVLNTCQSLLAGNVVVFKHSEECVLTSKLLASLMAEAGFPEGVFSCLYGDGEVGRELLNQKLNLVSFTGSSATGKKVYESAAKKFIPAILEMGGSSPGIVFEDSNLEATCASVYGERFSNCGQICCALKRLIVHSSIFDRVIAGLKSEMEEQVVGDPLDEKTTVGPLAARRQLDLVESQVEDARAAGAKIIVGGKRPNGLEGAFYEPTLITEIKPDSRIWREEVFGPVLPVIAFSSEEEAIALANDTPYGLSAFVYSSDQQRAARVASKLQAGQVSINGCSYFTDHAPFGGFKESGIGRNDGEYGYFSLTQMKVVSRQV